MTRLLTMMAGAILPQVASRQPLVSAGEGLAMLASLILSNLDWQRERILDHDQEDLQSCMHALSSSKYSSSVLLNSLPS